MAFAFLLCASAAAGKGLQSSTAYSVGSQLTAIAAADFNVDGHLDLLVVDSPGMTFSTVHVLLGNGDGTFQAALDSPATPNLSAVAVGRFDGDNFPDIAVTDSVLNQIRVLLGDGSGNFVANAPLPTGAAPAAIATGDINDDGKLDLVVANSDDMTLSIFIGVGNGTFITKPRVSTESVGLPGLVGVVIGDFDSDHKPDVVAAWNASAISILKGNGDGTFGTASVMSAASTNFTAIAATDFNLDGALDLIIPNTNNVLFLAGRNNLMFQTPVAFGAQTWPKAVAVGDANADGRPDLMVANWFSNSASVLLNNGLGGIAVARGYS